MTQVIAFHYGYHQIDGGYRKHQIVESLNQIARANGFEPQRPERIQSNELALDNLVESGAVVLCISVTNLCDDIGKLGQTIRALVGRGVRIISAETPDVVGALRLIESITAKIADLEKEVKQLRKADRSAEKLVREASAEIAGRMMDRLDMAVGALTQSFLGEEYADEFLKARRLLKAESKAKGTNNG